MSTGSDCAEASLPPWYSSFVHQFSSIRYRLKSWITQRSLNLVVWLNRDSNYIKHVRREVPDWFEDEGPDRWIADGTVELLAVLSHHGHSGGSIGFAVNFFKTMALFEPWGPLTGEDSEWTKLDYGEDVCYQNKRFSQVFKDADGRAYDSAGRVFREPDGMTFTRGGESGSRVYIDFPYTPKVEYVDVEKQVDD